MKKDFELIVRDFEQDIVIYPISDVHLGSLEHNRKEWKNFVEKIANEPNSYVILAGDLINKKKY
jgi:DNA polymerase II small subunit/DNA polymerase delta subunit B